MDGSPIRKERFAFSNANGYVHVDRALDQLLFPALHAPCKSVRKRLIDVLSRIYFAQREVFRMITTNIYEMDIYSRIYLMGNILAICVGSTIIDQFGYGWRDATLFPVYEHTYYIVASKLFLSSNY